MFQRTKLLNLILSQKALLERIVGKMAQQTTESFNPTQKIEIQTNTEEGLFMKKTTEVKKTTTFEEDKSHKKKTEVKHILVSAIVRHYMLEDFDFVSLNHSFHSSALFIVLIEGPDIFLLKLVQNRLDDLKSTC
jgi:hypothetical protein